MSSNGYRTPQALRAAMDARSKHAAEQRRRPSGEVRREFVYSRLLARIFRHDPTWVLKGGIALLARVHSARHSKDVDLLSALDDIDAALEALEVACRLDLHDHFRFVPEIPSPGAKLPHADIDGCRVFVNAYLGPVRVERFHVDVVTGSVMTQEPDVQVPRVIDLPGVEMPTYRLYPVVDHVADKVCATEMLYGPDKARSSRARDLVDLVVLARAHDMDGDTLIAAITAERVHRGLPASTSLDVPADWASRYHNEVEGVEACEGLNYTQAVEFVHGFLNPVLRGQAAGRRWGARDGAWC